MEKYLEYTKRFLDKIDLTPFLEDDRDLDDIMYAVGLVYDKEVKDDEVFRGHVFCCMSLYDFYEYLEERYPNFMFSHWTEVTHHYEVIGRAY